LRFLATMSNEISSFQFVSRKDEISFDIVAETGNIVAKTAAMSKQHSTLERIVTSTDSIRQCCMDIVAGMHVALGGKRL